MNDYTGITKSLTHFINTILTYYTFHYVYYAVYVCTRTRIYCVFTHTEGEQERAGERAPREEREKV